MTAPPPLRCAPAAALRGDPLWASAAPVQRWLLVELGGPWGRDAVRSFRLAPSLGDAVLARAHAAGVRLLLIRRHGRPAPDPQPGHRWAVVDSSPGSERSWWGTFSAGEELLDVPLDGSAGVLSSAPTYLVCTHGRHDPCCAIRGRPVAAALTAARPAETWECSHVGGDRFAANLVVLPHGLYYGHVPADAAAAVAAAYEHGLVVPTWLRGRSTYDAPVQAAQHHARVALGEYRLDALPPLSVDRVDATTWRVRLGAADGPLGVVVRATASTPARLTCSATGPGSTHVWALVAVERSAA